MAATAQAAFEQILSDEVRKAVSSVQRAEGRLVTGLVVTGGCALNVKANSRLQADFSFPVYVPASPSDAGLAIGAAWHVIAPPRLPGYPWGQPLQYLGFPVWDEPTIPGLVRDRWHRC